MTHITSKPASKEYRDGWDRMFGKRKRAWTVRSPFFTVTGAPLPEGAASLRAFATLLERGDAVGMVIHPESTDSRTTITIEWKPSQSTGGRARP